MKDWLKMHWIDSSMTQCPSYNCWWVWQRDQRYYQWRFFNITNFHGVYCTKCGALKSLFIPCEQNANKCNYAYSECLEECYWEDHIVQSKCFKVPCEKRLDPLRKMQPVWTYIVLSKWFEDSRERLPHISCKTLRGICKPCPHFSYSSVRCKQELKNPTHSGFFLKHCQISFLIATLLELLKAHIKQHNYEYNRNEFGLIEILIFKR